MQRVRFLWSTKKNEEGCDQEDQIRPKGVNDGEIMSWSQVMEQDLDPEVLQRKRTPKLERALVQLRYHLLRRSSYKFGTETPVAAVFRPPPYQ